MSRLNNLQEFGRIVLKERMLKGEETAAEFCDRMGDHLTGGDATKAPLVAALLGSVSLIPSSALCQHLNLEKKTTTPSACHLTLFSRSYEAQTKLDELNRVASMTITGTGVGVGADNLRYKGSEVPGELKNNFVELCQYLDAATVLNVSARKSKLAVFLSLHSINSMICLTLRQQNARITPNIFYGVMIPDFFMKMQRDNRDAMWYFFDGDATLEGASLNDCHGEEYECLYWRMVDAKLYVKKMRAVQVLGDIISCITENGFPYVVWRDTVNEYNNQRALGTVQTLNLCTEISQHSGTDASSMCTLMTINVAAYCEEYPLLEIYREVARELETLGMRDCCPDFKEGGEEDRLFMHCFCSAYMSVFVLNRLLDGTKRRELGLTPTGLFDAVYILKGREKAYGDAMLHYSGLVAEFIYLGAVVSSVAYNRLNGGVVCANFAASEFSRGLLQFDLRRVEPVLSELWSKVRPHMKLGMANSMLTAQAPTATTSLMTNVTESVQFPMPGAVQTTKNSGTGRFASVPYFLWKTNDAPEINRFVTIAKQVKMFERTAPFVDQSQSVIINCRPEYEDVFRVLRYTHDAKLKTAIYYLVFNSTTPYINLAGCDACTQ
jgi:ribonucleotide reductase alpha subunit